MYDEKYQELLQCNWFGISRESQMDKPLVAKILSWLVVGSLKPRVRTRDYYIILRYAYVGDFARNRSQMAIICAFHEHAFRVIRAISRMNARLWYLRSHFLSHRRTFQFNWKSAAFVPTKISVDENLPYQTFLSGIIKVQILIENHKRIFIKFTTLRFNE